MFRQAFSYWSSVKDNPSTLYKINLWSFINIRLYKFKFSRVLFFFINSCEEAKIKVFKIKYKDWIFEDYYFLMVKFFLILIVIIFLI